MVRYGPGMALIHARDARLAAVRRGFHTQLSLFRAVLKEILERDEKRL